MIAPLRWLWMPKGHSPQPAAAASSAVRQPGDPFRTGVCCSGGGLRSAAFSFGALDRLWRAGVLQRADYLAGVSGGSYAVTAATIVRVTSRNGHDPYDWDGDRPGPYGLGSPELDYLRNRTDYLAPGIAGRWNMLLRLLLGVFINLGVVLGLLYAFSRPAGWLYRQLLPELERCHVGGDVLATSCPAQLHHAWWALWIPAGLFLVGIAFGAFDLFFRPAADWWWRRLVRWCGAFVFLGIVSALVLWGVPTLLWWARTTDLTDGRDLSSVARLVGPVGSAAAAAVVSLVHVVLKSGTSGGRGSLPGRLSKLVPKARGLVQRFAVSVVAPLSLAVFSLIAIDLGARPWGSTGTWVWLGVVAVVAVIFIGGNPITWSAQPFYKRRLREVFALTRTVEGGREFAEPVPTDSEPRLSELRTDVGDGHWPQLLICAAANVSDRGATPPGLPVTSFVFSPTSVGGPLVGTVETAAYERRLDRSRRFQTWWWRSSSWLAARRRERDRAEEADQEQGVAPVAHGRLRDVSPLSAVSISGAAVAPSMGRMSQPSYRMLLALFNLRLGVWLPSPQRVCDDLTEVPETDWPTMKPYKLVRPTYLLREMFGRTSLRRRYLYVSDGGHYENLGLVELLRRGCTTIYAIDASGDAPGSVRALAQAVALARVELGVEFCNLRAGDFALDPERAGMALADHAIVKFDYPNNGGTGTLIYIKKALVDRGDAPVDVLAYQQARPVFPYDSTGDQFYDVEQFEAYRALGAYVTDQALMTYQRR